jgi:predicted ArsR family transcriptional regulator
MSQRQDELLQQLHEHPTGLTIDDLADALGVTRPAVRQHLTALEAEGLVAHGEQRRTAGRPVQAYVLAPKGRERFPRQYTFLAGQLLQAVARRVGPQGLEALLREQADEVAAALEPQMQGQDRLAKTVAVMNELGYHARQTGPDQISATNCVYHALAQEHPQICAFDVALLQRLTGAEVAHERCILRGSADCCFRLG